jgi:hemoglobin-like flavoprotein
MPLKRHPVAVSNTAGALARLPLDSALVAELRATYEQVRAHDSRLAEIFYAKLFAAAPQVRAMFRSDPAMQAAKLMAALDIVVRNLDAGDANVALLAQLGRRHAAYGARPEHYPLVTGLLIESMHELLGSRFSTEHREQWTLALTLITRQMLAAAEPGSGSTQPGDRLHGIVPGNG